MTINELNSRAIMKTQTFIRKRKKKYFVISYINVGLFKNFKNIDVSIKIGLQLDQRDNKMVVIGGGTKER